VPMLQCGFVRSNFAFAIALSYFDKGRVRPRPGSLGR